MASRPKGATGNPILPNGISPNVLPLTNDGTMRLPVVDAWNLMVERQLPGGVVFSAGYVGNKGTHVTPGGTNYNINQPTIEGFGTLSTNQRRLFFQKFGWSQSIKYFSDDGTTLIVTERATNRIDTYAVSGDGLLTGPVVTPRPRRMRRSAPAAAIAGRAAVWLS